MTRKPHYYSDKLNQFNKFSGRLNKMLSNGSFERLSSEKRNMLIHRLKRLYDQLLGLVSAIKLKHILAAAVALVLGLSTQTTHSQSFAPPQTNPFGLVSVYRYASPSFVDIDGDGDFDVFVGEWVGKLQYFENTGTNTAPAFAAPQANPFGLVSVNGFAYPDFIDIDGDGDFDAFVGEWVGPPNATALQYFENTGTNTAPAFDTAQANPFGLVSVSRRVAPDFVDIDGDGDFDVFMGNAFYYSSLSYFENTGTNTVPAFAAPQANPFGLVRVSGYITAPGFVDIDGDGDFDVFVGENTGALQYFKNTGTNTAPAFAAPQTNPFGLDSVSGRAAPSFVDIDGDGDFDVFVGEESGNLIYFENISPPPGIKDNDLSTNVRIYPNPTKANFNISIQGKNKLGEVTLEVTNLIGKTMLKEKIEVSTKKYSKEINTDKFAKGLYFVRLRIKDNLVVRKLIVQ